MTPHESRKLRASVRKVRGLIKEYGDCLRTERDAALAEIERLKARLTVTAQILIAEVSADRPLNAEDVAMRAVVRIREAEAEIERLRAHTWQQERAAIVKWLWTGRDGYYAEAIDRGEHWPEGGTP